MRRFSFAALAVLLLGVGGHGVIGSPIDDLSLAAPEYDNAFWSVWADGQAEVAGYSLVYPRYGELRHGSAVAIFVNEDFIEGDRVKADRPVADRFPVLKLNLVRDFATGLYDYNLMTSAFVALTPVQGRPAGTPTKVSFGAQEWCGHAYQQALFDADQVRTALHSYFQGEADREASLDAPPELGSEDALHLWARGLAHPQVAPGAQAEVPILTSLVTSRLRHRPATITTATLRRSSSTEELTVPAGSFVVREAVAEVGERSWHFYVEEKTPRRLIAWRTSDGERAELLGAERLKYWQLHDNGQEELLGRIGLAPRPPRTP